MSKCQQSFVLWKMTWFTKDGHHTDWFSEVFCQTVKLIFISINKGSHDSHFENNSGNPLFSATAICQVQLWFETTAGHRTPPVPLSCHYKQVIMQGDWKCKSVIYFLHFYHPCYQKDKWAFWTFSTDQIFTGLVPVIGWN